MVYIRVSPITLLGVSNGEISIRTHARTRKNRMRMEWCGFADGDLDFVFTHRKSQKAQRKRRRTEKTNGLAMIFKAATREKRRDGDNGETARWRRFSRHRTR